MSRPSAYKGDDPYIFVSYCHKDDARVWPMIEGLQKRGMRVWYDEGIEWGSHWDEVIFEHLSGCACVVAFVTNNFLQSENCKDEISYAKDEQKGPFLVFLDDLDLTGMMKYRYGRLQALNLHQFDGMDALLDTLATTQTLSTCRGTASRPVVQQTAPAPKPTAAASAKSPADSIESGNWMPKPTPTVSAKPAAAPAPASKAQPKTVTQEDPKKAESLALQAIEKYRDSKFEEAYRLSDQALAFDSMNSKANLMIGWIYHYGLSVKEDKNKALEHFYKSQEPHSYTCIGCYHYFGWGGKAVDKREALLYFMMGRQANNLSAMCNAAQCLEEGIALNSKTNRRERQKYRQQYLEEAADKGSLRACMVLFMDHLDHPDRVRKKYEAKYDQAKKNASYTGVIEAEKKTLINTYEISMGLLLE